MPKWRRQLEVRDGPTWRLMPIDDDDDDEDDEEEPPL